MRSPNKKPTTAEVSDVLSYLQKCRTTQTWSVPGLLKASRTLAQASPQASPQKPAAEGMEDRIQDPCEAPDCRQDDEIGSWNSLPWRSPSAERMEFPLTSTASSAFAKAVMRPLHQGNAAASSRPSSDAKPRRRSRPAAAGLGLFQWDNPDHVKAKRTVLSDEQLGKSLRALRKQSIEQSLDRAATSDSSLAPSTSQGLSLEHVTNYSEGQLRIHHNRTVRVASLGDPAANQQSASDSLGSLSATLSKTSTLASRSKSSPPPASSPPLASSHKGLQAQEPGNAARLLRSLSLDLKKSSSKVKEKKVENEMREVSRGIQALRASQEASGNQPNKSSALMRLQASVRIAAQVGGRQNTFLDVVKRARDQKEVTDSLKQLFHQPRMWKDGP